MRVAFSSSGSALDASVDQRFGRCACFAIVDTETMEHLVVPNPGAANPGAAMGQGAGIQAAQAVAAQGVDAVVTGQMGPNAYQALSAAGIRMYAGPYGTVREALELLNAEKLPWITGATGPALHEGEAAMGAQTAAGYVAGGGMGRGMGWRHGAGHGRGHGHGFGRGMGRGPAV